MLCLLWLGDALPFSPPLFLFCGNHTVFRKERHKKVPSRIKQSCWYKRKIRTLLLWHIAFLFVFDNLDWSPRLSAACGARIFSCLLQDLFPPNFKVGRLLRKWKDKPRQFFSTFIVLMSYLHVVFYNELMRFSSLFVSTQTWIPIYRRIFSWSIDTFLFLSGYFKVYWVCLL